MSDFSQSDVGDVDLGDLTVSPEQRRAKREAKRPSIDHLAPATAEHDGNTLALFDVGDRVVVERRYFHVGDIPQWLDTRVYKVLTIDDLTGVCQCFDEQADHRAYLGFKDPCQTWRLAPAKGDPFAANKLARLIGSDPGNQGKTPGNDLGNAISKVGMKTGRRGRPKGSKNRPKSVVNAERRERQEAKAAKRAARISKRERKNAGGAP